MRVLQLKMSCFRNYRELDIHPSGGINIFHGANAQGKTNILEAISLLATTRSLRAGRESEMILRDSEEAHVIAEIKRECEGEAELHISVFQTDRKSVRVNGVKRPRVIDLLGQFNAVFFGATEMAIVTGEPADRRHYMNIEISQISPRYVYDLGHYKRILEQRNRLLKDLRERPRPTADTGLEAWNEQLINYGAPLFEKRRFFIDRLAPLAAQIHRELTEGRETLEVRYLPSVRLPVDENIADAERVREKSAEDIYTYEAKVAAEGEPSGTAQSSPGGLISTETIANEFREQLCKVAADELRRGTTLLGPQRDDLSFLINGLDARVYGSQGQQRTVTLALKLAEYRLIEDYVGEPPVLLLDDVMSDLDDSRRKHLLTWIANRGQTFITCTNLRAFPKDMLSKASKYKISSGEIVATPVKVL